MLGWHLRKKTVRGHLQCWRHITVEWRVDSDLSQCHEILEIIYINLIETNSKWSGVNKRPTDLTLRKYQHIVTAFIPQKHFEPHQYPDYPWQDRAESSPVPLQIPAGLSYLHLSNAASPGALWTIWQFWLSRKQHLGWTWRCGRRSRATIL